MHYEEVLTQRLEQAKQSNLYRSRKVLQGPQGISVRCQGKDYLSFCSNDYLGLANHPKLIRAFQEGCKNFGVGTGASQLITGHSSAHADVEKAFAKFLKRDRALYFANGYMANVGVLTALMKGNKNVIYQDKLNHASLIDGALLSQARLERYQHQDMQHLETLLKKSTTPWQLIATDGVFSMNGKIAPLSQLAALAKQYNSLLMVDDAHGIGVLGKQGGGSLELFQLSQQEVPILICPLGKAFGCYGAIVAGSEALIENLIQFSRSYIYTTALPSALAMAALTSLDITQNESKRRDHLNNIIEHFKKGIQQKKLSVIPSDTPIQILKIGDEGSALQLSRFLFDHGILVQALRYPTVSKNQAILRITLSAQHTDQHIETLLNALALAHETTSNNNR